MLRASRQPQFKRPKLQLPKSVQNWAANGRLYLTLLLSALAPLCRGKTFQRQRCFISRTSRNTREVENLVGLMKTYQECIREYDEKIPHRSDAYMLGFLDTIAFIFNKSRIHVSQDIQAYRTKRYYEEEEA
jgi:hypothetical protein